MPCSVACIRFLEPIWQRLRNGKTWDAYHWKHLRSSCRPSFNDIQWDNQGSLTDSPGILSRRFSAYFLRAEARHCCPSCLRLRCVRLLRVLRITRFFDDLRSAGWGDGCPKKLTEGTAFQHVSTEIFQNIHSI